MKKILIPIIILIGLGFNGFAKSAWSSPNGKSDAELQGDKFYHVYSFDKAINSYTFAKKLSIEGQRRLAESYHNLDQNIQSEEAYLKLTSASEVILPEDYYSYSMVLKTNGKYDLAGNAMDKFAALKPSDLRARDYVAHKNELPNLLKDNNKYKINRLSVNTVAEDFGPCYYKNKVVFASTRGNDRAMQKKFNWNRKPFLDLYITDVEGDQLKNPAIFDKNLNAKWHNGPASFSNNGTFMAFTCNTHGIAKKERYDDNRRSRLVELQICFSNYKDGKWSEHIPFSLNSTDYAIGQPCLSADGNTMYFTSDMPGGFGGADIYRIIKDGAGNWGKAENLGDKINTEGDEMFPFLDEKNKMLYFASNGRFGLGGQDVFICALNGSGFGTAQNAGAPLNTQFDDFAVIVNDNKGYFSSNRIGGSGSDDIYSFDLLSTDKKIEGFAKDNEGKHIPTTTITLLNERDSILNTLITKDDGAYTFTVQPNKNYKLIGKKENYRDGDNVANTFGKESIVKVDLVLLKAEVVAQKIKVGADLGKILEFSPNKIYFDYDKFNIRKDAEPDLAKIAKIMNEYPNMVVELGSYADCRAPKKYNQVLSDKRAKASADYIKSRITKPERIYGKGYGETKLVNGCACEGKVVSNCSEEEHQQNRRTEFIIVKKIMFNKSALTTD